VTLIDAGGKPSQALAGDSDGATAMRLLLRCASKTRATDIHMEPKLETDITCGCAWTGRWWRSWSLPKRVGELSYGLIKTACQMQDGRRGTRCRRGTSRPKFPDRRVDYRVSFTPSVHGQKLVLRVLDSRALPRRSRRPRPRRGTCWTGSSGCAEQDHGLLLVCGPTGSGKTTTLYNAIREIDRTPATW
jgi:type II secretory ATPase GspE/PulE/Tfp pilus assembly ATPase PilB-like protein